jgi:hypothetical protein
MRKLPVIHITEPFQVGKDGADYRIIEFLITKLGLDLRPAAGPIRKKTVSRIPGLRQGSFFQLRTPHS